MPAAAQYAASALASFPAEGTGSVDDAFFVRRFIFPFSHRPDQSIEQDRITAELLDLFHVSVLSNSHFHPGGSMEIHSPRQCRIFGRRSAFGFPHLISRESCAGRK